MVERQVRHLPTRREQQWLLGELAGLVRSRGIEPFVSAPIVLPTDEFFPDPVSSVAATADRVTRRLMQYAGLGHLQPVLDFIDGQTIAETEEGTHCHGIAGCFFGIVDGACHFGIDASAAQEPEQLAGVMGHEVAHAYRAAHGLCVEDRDQEELLTDLTTVYLGFGVLSANNSYRFRKSGGIDGAMAYTAWSTTSSGYLPPQALSFLLGAQIEARQLEERERKAILGRLETNQAAFVGAAVEALASSAVDLQALLGLPPFEAFPPRRAARDILTPLEPFDGDENAGELEEPDDAGSNRGRAVFRVREPRVAPHALMGGVCFGLAGIVLLALAEKLGSPVSPYVALAPFAGGLMWGARRGRAAEHDVCSDAGCEAVLDVDVTRCPSCAGEVMGRLDSPSQRLEMAEKFAREARQRAQRS